METSEYEGSKKSTAVYNLTCNENGDGIELVLKNYTGSNEPEEVVNEESTELNEHVCSICERSYKLLRSLIKHKETCKKKVDTCEELTMEQILKFEKDAASLAEQNICYCCKESFETAHSGHIRCQECPKSFKDVASYRRHVSFLHSSIQNALPCTVCNAKCATPAILNLHLTAHETGKQFACPKCGKEFTRKYHLLRHQNYSNCDPSVAKPTNECNVCGKEFFRIDNLRSHLRQHIGESTKNKDYECPYCQKCFQGTTTLNIHIRTHTGEKPYICDICQRGFPSLGAVRKHRRSHTGEKPFECQVCDRHFAAKEVLNRHMKTHTGERPHVCTICSKGFIQATQLKTHMFQHTGSNGYSCEKCGTQFNRRKGLSDHMVTYHSYNKNVFDCTQCVVTHESKEELADHMKCHIGAVLHRCRACRIKFLHIKNHLKCSLCTICQRQSGEKLLTHEHVKTTTYKTQKIDLVNFDNIPSDSKEEKPRKLKVLTSKPNNKRKKPVANEQQVNEGETLTLLAWDPDKDLTEYTIKMNTSTSPSAKLKVKEENDIDEYTIEMKTPTSQLSKKKMASKHSSPVYMSDERLNECVTQLLNLLLDAELLSKFDWPDSSVEHVLSSVINQCDHKPADYDTCPDYGTKMRENVKLLITVVVDNDSIKSLLNNHTIDEVILQIVDMTS